MVEINTSEWTPIGETANSRYFAVEPEIIAVVPHLRSTDDARTAQENQDFQLAHWKRLGHPGVVVIFFDRMVSQDKDARRVYQRSDPAWMRGTALVGGSLLGRAMGSFFLGLSRPPMPIKLFDRIEPALVWARQLNHDARARAAAPAGGSP